MPAPHHDMIAEKLESVARGEIKRLRIHMPPRHGKALEINTPIPTPDGWRRMGDLRLGDAVFDEQGMTCRVVAVSPVWRDRPVYRVLTDDGDEIIADAEHEWPVRLCRKRPVVRLKTTRYLAARKSKRAPCIAAAKPLHLPSVDLPIDPYVLGVWLGDGRTKSSAICSADDEIIAEVSRIEGGHNDYTARGNTHHFRIGPHYRSEGVAASQTLQGRLRMMGLIGNKRIPTTYLRASAEQRLALLQGLIDTDGYVAGDGQVEFCSMLSDLANDVKELVATLGHKASIVTGRATCNGKDCGTKYRVMFYMAGAARLTRKAVKCRHGKRAFNRYIAVEPAGVADTVCIEVDSPSHLFLAGKSMLPTHNSELASKRFPAWFMGNHPRRHMIAASYNSDLAADFGREVRNIVASRAYRSIFDTSLAEDSSAANRWHTEHGGMYAAVGIGTATTGRGAHVLLIDDPLKDREEADSERHREKVWRWYTSTAYTRLESDIRFDQISEDDQLWFELLDDIGEGRAEPFDGAIVLICTRWHEDDLAGRVEAAEVNGGDAWDVLDLPAILSDGRALWHQKFPLERLEKIRATLDIRDWSALYQQRPTPEEGDYFKREWFKFYDKPPAHLRTYGASDYAVTANGGDYTVHVVCGVDPDDNLYVLDVWRRQVESHIWVEEFLNLVARHKPLNWGEENGQIVKSLGPFIDKRMRERRIYCRREQMASVADKPTRARSFQARAAMGKVYMPHGAHWVTDLMNEMLTFPAGKHDDQIDALGLIGRMLDTMVSARVPAAQPGPESRWAQAFKRRQQDDTAASWKTL